MGAEKATTETEMITNEAINQYALALKAGQRCYRERVLKGEYPYLQVLDEILTERFAAYQVELGVIEIPTDRIVGTTSAGRRDAFAANFMPLLPADSEFGSKWTNLCAESLADGIRDPVRCFEYLGRFYIQEGNKRVSVLKSFDAPTVSASVARIIPPWSEDEEIRVYYEFMEFYRLSKSYAVSFSKLGSYKSLQAALGYDADHVWTEDERKTFASGIAIFSRAAASAGAKADSELFLLWLKVYGYDKLQSMDPGELTASIAGIIPDAALIDEENPIAVSTAPEEAHGGLINKLIGAVTLPNHLKIAFINDRSPEESHWVASHVLGSRALAEHFGKKVTVKVYNGDGGDEDELFDRAAADGAEVIFATTPALINSCRRAAAKYPAIKLLNCSISMPFPGVRTYYSRIYEGKFISGAVAGAMTKTGRVGYVASNPIYGVPAGINAFALGAALTCPDVRISLRWSCCTTNAFEELVWDGCDMLSARDVPTKAVEKTEYGLLRVEGDRSLTPIISPVWNWGQFYIQIVNGIFNGAWDDPGDRGKALNYWWGFDGGAVGLKTSEAIPQSMAELAELLRRGIKHGGISPFARRIVTQDGTVINDGKRWLTPEEILNIDWLADNIDGSIPSFDELLPIAKPLVRLLGIHRYEIPPDKDELQL